MLACIISHNLTPKGAKIADKGRKGLVIAKGYIYPHKSKKRAWRACGGLTGYKVALWS